VKPADFSAKTGSSKDYRSDSGCTNGCTSESKTDQTDTVGTLAAALLSLSPSDRARLAALLLEPVQQKDSTEAPPTRPESS
jgi:hypothetical protein